MRFSKAWVCLGSLLVLTMGPGNALSQFAPTVPAVTTNSTKTPDRSLGSIPFTLTASNTTMPSDGFGVIHFTLTAMNGYTGAVNVGCTPPTPPAGTNIPTCAAPEPYGSGFDGITVTLSASMPVVKNSTLIYALPASLASQWSARSNHPRSGDAAELALAGVLILGLGFRKRKLRWPACLLLAAMMLIGLTGITACASPYPNFPTLTPGTYTYTVSAVAIDNSYSTSTTVTVTVPQGIVVL